METRENDYWKLFKPSTCSLLLAGQTKQEVFEEIVRGLVKAKGLTAQQEAPAVQALLEREEKASTGIGCNVAIPHVQLAGLDAVVASLSVHRQGVDWSALDGERVHIFFSVFRPMRAGGCYDPERHLEMMRWISGLGRIGDFRNFALAAKTRTELVDLLKEMAERTR